MGSLPGRQVRKKTNDLGNVPFSVPGCNGWLRFGRAVGNSKTCFERFSFNYFSNGSFFNDDSPSSIEGMKEIFIIPKGQRPSHRLVQEANSSRNKRVLASWQHIFGAAREQHEMQIKGGSGTRISRDGASVRVLSLSLQTWVTHSLVFTWPRYRQQITRQTVSHIHFYHLNVWCVINSCALGGFIVLL